MIVKGATNWESDKLRCGRKFSPGERVGRARGEVEADMRN